MTYKNLFTFFISCETDNNIQNTLKNYEKMTLKTVFRKDICDIVEKNVIRYDLTKFLQNTNIYVINLINNIKLIIEDAFLYIFNSGFNKNISYSIITLTTRFTSDEELDLKTLMNQFFLFNEYRYILDTSNESTLFEININDKFYRYRKALDNENISREKPISSINQLLAATLIREINDYILNVDINIKNDFIIPSFRYQTNWLSYFADSNDLPITEEEHELAKQFILGNRTRIILDDTPCKNNMYLNYYTSYRSAFVFAKGEYYIQDVFEQHFKNYLVQLYLFAFNEHITINRHIKEIQGRLTDKINVIKNKDDINHEMEVFNQIISKFSFDNPTALDSYNYFYKKVKESQQIESARRELELDRSTLNSDILKEETIIKDRRNRDLWYWGIASQIALGFIAFFADLWDEPIFKLVCMITFPILTFVICGLCICFIHKKESKIK